MKLAMLSVLLALPMLAAIHERKAVVGGEKYVVHSASAPKGTEGSVSCPCVRRKLRLSKTVFLHIRFHAMCGQRA